MIFGFHQVAAVAAWAALTFMQLSQRTSMKNKDWYDLERPMWALPGYVFPWVWTLMYSALTIAMYYFTRNTKPDSWNIITAVTLYIFHIMCNKLWSVYFWDMNDPETALNILVFPMMLSASGLMCAFIIGQSGLFWIPVMCLGIYALWLFYAAALNIHWVNQNLETMSPDEREASKVKTRSNTMSQIRRRLIQY